MKQGDEAEALRGLFRSQSSIQAAYLHGSVVRGEAWPESDADVAVLLAAGAPLAPQDEALRLEGDLERLVAQTVLDIASHIVSDKRLGEPRTNRDLFDLLARKGWIGADRRDGLRRMAGFRNILVHGYAEVDPGIVQHVAENRLVDLEDFVAAVRPRIQRRLWPRGAGLISFACAASASPRAR